jgi:hypothetical protein
VSAEYPYDGTVRGKLLVVNGWDYLASPNNLPSYGGQLEWDVNVSQQRFTALD